MKNYLKKKKQTMRRLFINNVISSVFSCTCVFCITELAPVEELRVFPERGQLLLEWKPPNNTSVSEYVVEWVTGDKIDWKRENRSTSRTAIRGNLSSE